jgi:glycosyltransferase involved in cell wall biosynthesis
VFQPRARTRADGERFTVLHYSKFAPLHGIDTILEAARRLRGERDIRFVLVGGGQLEESVRQRIAELELDQVELHPWMEPAQLREVIAGAGACLGVFGASEKAARVIPNKIYQYMAVGAPIITRDGAGPRELLRDGEHVLLCPPADAEALARAIVRLRDDPALREQLARNARELFIERCSPLVIGRELAADLEQVVGGATIHARAH